MEKNNTTLLHKLSWISRPSTKKQLLLVISLWLFILLSVVGLTDFFTEPFFQQKYIGIYLLFVWSTIRTAISVIKYFKRDAANLHVEKINTTLFNNPSWIKNPSTKKQLSIIISLWVFALLFSILGLTRFFAEPFFQPKYVVIYLLILGHTLATAMSVRRYFKRDY